MKITISIVSDVIFSAFISFVLSFVMLNYYLDRTLAIILSVLISLLLSVLIIKRLLNKNQTAKLKKSDADSRNDMSVQLNLSTESEQLSIFEKALKTDGYSIEKKKGGLFIKDKNSVVFPKFNFDGISKTDIVKVFNTIKNQDVAYVLSENFTAEIKAFAERFDGRIKTIPADDIYFYLKEKDCLPQNKFVFPQKKRLTISAFKNLFQKKKAKNFLWFGLIFLFSSYFVPIKTYYVICGALFLLLALISRIYGKQISPTAN